MSHRRVVLGAWVVVAACGKPPAAVAPVPTAAPVRPGIEVLLLDSLSLVGGMRLGLVTNQSGVDHLGVGDVERLRGAGLNLVALFSPEHGFRGSAPPGAEVANSVDSATSLPIYSLYGRNRSVTPEMLAGVDVILVDLQDAGARYFTYLATTVEVLRAAARDGKRVLLLDRPNPIADAVQGNVLDTAFASSVGLLPVPMRHGLTLGELARLANMELGVGADLTVIPVAGWRTAQYWDDTGLPFIPPSPNLRTLEALLHYPGLCLFEGTNLSVGRGSGHPFEQVGAPWLDSREVVERLEAARLPGVRFSRVHFTPHDPGDGKYADTALAGIRLTVTDRATYDPTRTAVVLMATIRDVHPDRLRWNAAQFDRLAGNSVLRLALEQGASPEVALGAWPDQRQAYLERRRTALLYPRAPAPAQLP